MDKIHRKRRGKIPKKNRDPTIEDDTSNLPCEVIENILSRLPVKSLLRFKSVSKPWYSLISDPKFARFHLNQSKNLNYKTLSLRWRYPTPREFTLLKFTEQSFQFESLEFPIQKYRDASILCSCDGLVLLKNSFPSDKMCVLWNPSTRTYTKFSCKHWIRCWSSDPLNTYGLCYDASSDDYKFVLLLTNISYTVFSYKNNSWIKKEGLGEIMPDRGPGLFVNGALHWLATKGRKDSDSTAKEDILLQQLYHKHCPDCNRSHYVDYPGYECNYSYTYEICCFDPRDDNFKKLCKPACFDVSSVFHLTDLGGQLCLYRNTYDFKMVEIWMMKEYGDVNSWTKLLTIENLPAPHSCKYIKPLCLTNKNYIVLDINGFGIVVYNPLENKFCEMNINGTEKVIRVEDMNLTPHLSWSDSLVLPTRN